MFNSSLITIAVGAGVVNLSPFASFNASGISSGVTVSPGTDTMTIITPGIYQVHYTITERTTTSATNWSFTVAVNGVPVPKLSLAIESVAFIGAAVDQGGATTGFLSLAAGNVLSISATKNAGGAGSITVVSNNLNIHLIDD